MARRMELRRTPGGEELSAERLGQALEVISRDGLVLSFDAEASCVRARVAVETADAVALPIELSAPAIEEVFLDEDDFVARWSERLG